MVHARLKVVIHTQRCRIVATGLTVFARLWSSKFSIAVNAKAKIKGYLATQ